MTADQVLALEGFEYVVSDDGVAGAPLLLFHKTGGDERQLLPLASEVAPGRMLVALRGNVLEDGRRRFFRRIAPGVFDEQDLRQRADMLSAFIEAFMHRHSTGRPLALGLSNGANMIAALMLLHPKCLDGAALLRPAPPFAHSPATDLAGKRIFAVAGTRDNVVPASDTDRLVEEFRFRGAEVKRIDLDAAHDLVANDGLAVRDWFAEGDANSPAERA